MNLDQFQSLERVGSTIYIGFNDGIEKVVFARLVHVEGAIVIEGNSRLKEVSFPALESVGRYVHIHDNASLDKLELPKLVSVGGEISLIDNPRLKEAKVASRTSPARAPKLEVSGNGAGSYSNVHTRTAP